MVDVFKEVDEELKNEEFSKWLRKYGVIVLIFAVLLILTTAVNSIYRSNKLKANAKATEILNNLSTMENTEDMIKASAELDTKHAFLADFLIAAKYSESGELNKSMNLYETIFTSNELPVEYTDLARIYFVQNLLNLEEGDLNKAKEVIKPILNKENSFYYVATELNALIADKLGNKKEAKEILNSLNMDSDTPRSISIETEKLETLYK